MILGSSYGLATFDDDALVFGKSKNQMTARPVCGDRLAVCHILAFATPVGEFAWLFPVLKHRELPSRMAPLHGGLIEMSFSERAKQGSSHATSRVCHGWANHRLSA
jgi:hypothetical protein